MSLFLLAIVFALFMALVASLGLLAWIARGEPDSTSAPERDAGLSDDEIERRSSSWYHGSARCATRPCLEHADALNTHRMIQDIQPR